MSRKPSPKSQWKQALELLRQAVTDAGTTPSRVRGLTVLCEHHLLLWQEQQRRKAEKRTAAIATTEQAPVQPKPTLEQLLALARARTNKGGNDEQPTN